MTERRAMLYSKECPEGEIFAGEELEKALKSKNWQDTPLNADKKAEYGKSRAQIVADQEAYDAAIAQQTKDRETIAEQNALIEKLETEVKGAKTKITELKKQLTAAKK